MIDSCKAAKFGCVCSFGYETTFWSCRSSTCGSNAPKQGLLSLHAPSAVFLVRDPWKMDACRYVLVNKVAVNAIEVVLAVIAG